MNHRAASELLADLAEHRLETGMRAEVEAHTAGCAACREWLETYRLLGRAGVAQPETQHPAAAELAAWVALEAADDLPADAMSHLEECATCRHDLQLLASAIGAARRERPWAKTASRRATIAWSVAASLALVVLAAALMRGPRGGASGEVISGVTLSGTRTITARSIHASAAQIETGSHVVFRADELVSFGEDFVVAEGATFAAGGTRQAAAAPGSFDDEIQHR